MQQGTHPSTGSGRRQVCGRLYDVTGQTETCFLWLLLLCRVRTRRPVGVAARYVDVFMVSLVKLWPMGDLLLLSLSRVRTRRPTQVMEVKGGGGVRSCLLVC